MNELEGVTGYNELESAFRWLMSNDPVGALRFVTALETYFARSGHLELGARLTEQAVHAFITLGSTDRDAAAALPRAILAASSLALGVRDIERAHQRAHDCIRAAILVNDRTTAALAHVNLAVIGRQNGDSDEVAKHSAKAKELDPQLDLDALIDGRAADWRW